MFEKENVFFSSFYFELVKKKSSEKQRRVFSSKLIDAKTKTRGWLIDTFTSHPPVHPILY
jgi:hypothetical protein